MELELDKLITVALQPTNRIGQLESKINKYESRFQDTNKRLTSQENRVKTLKIKSKRKFLQLIVTIWQSALSHWKILQKVHTRNH